MKNIIHVPSRIIKFVRRKRKTARNPQHNDFYIVAFPKSGITWLSTILANAALISSGRREVASYTSVHLFVPDIHVTRDIGPMVYDTPPTRMIKSHSEFNSNYNFVIYLARNPMDVMKSYRRFNQEVGDRIYSSFDAFCRSKKFGVPAWKRHVRSWLDGDVIAQRLHVCRYEDLIENAVNEVVSISDNFGWNIDLPTIELAVAKSSVEKMKQSEMMYKSRNPRHTMTFVRGKSDTEIENKTVEYINSECRNELKLLGY